MKRLLFAALAILAVASCKEKDDPAGELSPIARQWFFVPDDPNDVSQYIDFSLPGGKMAYIPGQWQDYPVNATYLISKSNVSPYTGTRKDDGYHIRVQESWGIVNYYLSDVTDKNATITIYDDAHSYEYGGKLSLPEKPLKVAESPLEIISFQKGFRTQILGTPPSSFELFKKLQKTSYPVLFLDAQGKPEDYEGKDVSGKIVSVLHPFILDGPADYSVAQKVATAASKGAVAIVLNIKTDLAALTLEQYNELPLGKEEIPIAVWHFSGVGLSTPVDGGNYTLDVD